MFITTAGGGIIAGGLLGGLLGGKGSSQSGTQTVTQKQELDPRIAAILFGDGGENKGLLSQYQALGQQTQDPRLQEFGNSNLDYLHNAGQDMGQLRDTATNLINGTAGNRTGTSAWAVGNMVDAPKQNGMDLSGSYNSFINGVPGANPYLTKGIQGALDQSTNQFRGMQSDLTDNLQRNILPGIRSNSVIAGQYGGSRQGVAEGLAASDLTKQLSQASTQFGQNNTNAGTNAQLQAYDSDRNRQLAATQGLGAQQYGLAQQNAATKNAAEFMNVNRVNDNNTINANLAQQGATLGAGMLGGQLGSAAAAGTNQDNYGLNHAAQTNGLLAPYLGLNGSSTTSQPIYQNTGGNILGGAAAGLGLMNQFNQSGWFNGAGANPTTPYNWNSGGNDGWTLPNGTSIGT